MKIKIWVQNSDYANKLLSDYLSSNYWQEPLKAVNRPCVS